MPELTPLAKAIRMQGWGAQRRLARRLGISESELSRIVNGRTHADDGMRRTLADALGRPVDELFPTDWSPERLAA